MDRVGRAESLEQILSEGVPRTVEEGLDRVFLLRGASDFDRAWVLSQLHGIRVGEAIALVKKRGSEPSVPVSAPLVVESAPVDLEPEGREPESSEEEEKPKPKRKRTKKKDSSG